MKRALISVSDKTGITEFAHRLAGLGYEIFSTGGTYKTLTENGLEIRSVTDITGFPECLDGRLKTLHPKIHGGLLAVRGNKKHMDEMFELGIELIDMLVVNLYPFKQTIQKDSVTLAEAIENIDIGGPAMLRSAAKNYQDVCVITDPGDYENVLSEIESNGKISRETGLYLAAKVFEHTSHYDCLISGYLNKQTRMPEYPQTLTLTYEKQSDLRYGENPHQSAAFYREIGKHGGNGLTEAVQMHGKPLSYNNINDLHGALELLREFDEPTVVACKHSNPCGVGSEESVYGAYMKAYSSDPVSIFGGIIAVNGEICEKTAEAITKVKTDIVLAKSFKPEALEILTKKKNIILLMLDNIEKRSASGVMEIKKVSGGILAQSADNILLNSDEIQYVTNRRPTEYEMRNLLFAFKLVKHVKSNGIAIAKDGQSLGLGVGQVNRIWACRQAIEHAKEALGADILNGAALASDAYFPFPDCVEEAHSAGITAIIQPGGSINDSKSIELCDKYGIAMIFTGIRHFRH